MSYGHEVRWFVGPDPLTGQRNSVGDGLVKKVNEFVPSVKWADLVYLQDNSKYLHALEGFRKQGYPIWGANKETASWELDRAKGQEIFQNAGIEIIPSKSFTKYQEARSYVLQTKQRLVSKPNGDVDKALSYVSPKDFYTESMCFMLDKWHKEGKMKDEFILQEFVEGTEFAVGGFFGLNGFNEYVLENFEHKKFMNDDKGVNTGEMATTIKYTNKSKLAEQVLFPLTPELFRSGHTGYIDVSVIISKDGTPLPMEFTNRPGWPLEQIRMALEQGDVASWMLDCLNGQDTFCPSADHCTGVVVTGPGFPYHHFSQEENTGYPIYGIVDENVNDLHYDAMKLGEAPDKNGNLVPALVSCGDSVMVVTGTGKSVKQASDKCYKTVKEIVYPNSPGYRTDAGYCKEESIKELQKKGYAESWKFE